MAEKIRLYIDSGAREVWLVSEDGELTIHGPEGKRTTSVFPFTPPTIIQ